MYVDSNNTVMSGVRFFLHFQENPKIALFYFFNLYLDFFVIAL
jgi:hypothetical protein